MVSLVERFDYGDPAVTQSIENYRANAWKRLRAAATGSDLSVINHLAKHNAAAVLGTVLAYNTVSLPTSDAFAASAMFTFGSQQHSSVGVVLGLLGRRTGVAAGDATSVDLFATVYEDSAPTSKVFLAIGGGGTVGAALPRLTIVDVTDRIFKRDDAPTTETRYLTAQQLRIRVEPTQGGALVRAYVNTDDDSDPSAQLVVQYEPNTDYGITWNTKGYWFFGVTGSASGPAADQAFVLEMSAEDVAVETVSSFLRDRPRMLDLIQLTNMRFSGSARSTGVVADKVRQSLVDAQNELLDRCGGKAFFIRNTESLTFESSGISGIVLAPSNVARIHSVYDASQNELPFSVVGQQNGKLMIQFGAAAGSAFLVDYEHKIPPFHDDDDRTVIPARNREALVLTAALKLAGDDSNPQHFQVLAAQAERAVQGLLQSCNRFEQQRQPALRIKRGRLNTIPGTRVGPFGAIWP